MIQLITNENNNSHLDLVINLLRESEDVFIMAAFLKLSGLKLIERHLNKPRIVKIIAGANFGLTEPAALKQIFKLSDTNRNLSGYINKLDSKEIFHPKMYLFRSGNTGHVIVGSANLTGGGLEKNNECSLYTQCKVTDKVWIDSMRYFERCISVDNAEALNDRIIGLYTGYFNEQRKANECIEKFPDISDSLIYNFEKLKSLYLQFDQKAILDGIKEKEANYIEARRVLDKMVAHQHSDTKFKQLLEKLVGKPGQFGLWHSNGMFRHKAKIFAQQKEFRDLVKFVKNNVDKAPCFIYKGAKDKIKMIKGVGPNFVGEIMMTYAPKKLANINRNPITVLIQEGCANLKNHTRKFDGPDYEEYNNIVRNIAEKLELKNMLAADYFFNCIYQELKALGKLSKKKVKI